MTQSSGLPPSIIVSARDADQLDALMERLGPAHPAATQALAREIDRARIVAHDQMPNGTVMMHSRVECEDDLQGGRHALTLVLPHEADVDQGKVSILAPVGTALLGLSVGQSIDWDAPGGRRLRLRVTAVHQQG